MNPFEKKDKPSHVDVVDDPEGARVLLECQKCGATVHEGKYWPSLEILSWQCHCGHITKQRFVME